MRIFSRVALRFGFVLAWVYLNAPLAQARNEAHVYPVQDVLQQRATKEILGDDLQVRFGLQPESAQQEQLGVVKGQGKADPYSGNGVGRHQRGDEETCREAFRNALADLSLQARKRGANALLDVVSYYDNQVMNHPSAYECHSGMTRGVVELRARLAKVLGSAPGSTGKVHEYAVPPDSQFAVLGDVIAVPVKPEGKPRYEAFLQQPQPRAFAVSEVGGWWMSWNDPQAMNKALQNCSRTGKRCWLYAVDSHVVWQTEPEQRIGSQNLRAPGAAP